MSIAKGRSSPGRWLLGLLAIYCQPAYVMMAGVAPDSPAARVDANTVESPFSGVGSMVVSGAVTTGVVVAPRYVLTASHVVSGAPLSTIQFVLNFGGDRTHVFQAQSVTIYPTANFPYDDLALVELATPVPPGVEIYPLLRDSVAAGQRITLVGYGGSGNGDTGWTIAASSSVKRVGQNIIDLLLPTLYQFDFDGPTPGPTGGPTLGNDIETLIAGGDSGSPAFAGSPGDYRLLGINVFTSGPSGDYRFGIRGGGVLLTQPQYLNWIDATTGYTTVGLTYVDAPTLPAWAAALALCLLGAAMINDSSGRARMCASMPLGADA